MSEIHELAESMAQRAWRVVEDSGVVRAWESVGATVHIVGSLKMGLLISNRDIDLHVYTPEFDVADGFRAVAAMATNPRLTSLHYVNLLDAEDRCIEWHAFYEDEHGDEWQLDMIHILNDSPYAGYFERVAERVRDALTPETREAILRIKHAISGEKKVMGIHIYQAVLEGGARDPAAYWRWREANPGDGIISWMP